MQIYTDNMIIAFILEPDFNRGQHKESIYSRI